MAHTFHLTISTPDDVLIDQDVEYVSLPTSGGEVGLMANHMPLVNLISPGTVRVDLGKGEEKILATGGGFAKIGSNRTKIFVQTAEFAESIDEKRAIEAQEEAKKLMQEKVDNVSMADAQALLERNVARLKTIERKKRRSQRKV